MGPAASLATVPCAYTWELGNKATLCLRGSTSEQSAVGLRFTDGFQSPEASSVTTGRTSRSKTSGRGFGSTPAVCNVAGTCFECKKTDDSRSKGLTDGVMMQIHVVRRRVQQTILVERGLPVSAPSLILLENGVACSARSWTVASSGAHLNKAVVNAMMGHSKIQELRSILRSVASQASKTQEAVSAGDVRRHDFFVSRVREHGEDRWMTLIGDCARSLKSDLGRA